MKIRKKDLVRVKSFDELRVGMTVVVKNCLEAGDKDAAMLLTSWHSMKCNITSSRAFHVAPNYVDTRQGWCFCGALMERTLYRLRDEAPTEDQHTTEDVPKAKERVK